MGAGIWFFFMLALIVVMMAWVDNIPKGMSILDHADLRFTRVKQGLTVLAIIGVVTVPLFVWLFDKGN